MKLIIVDDYKQASIKAANYIASQLLLKPNSVIGLATGSTSIGIYKELIRMYKNDEVDFSQATTFNLDEYYGLDPKNPNSYTYFMYKNLFNSINLKKQNINIPNGLAKDIEKECIKYEDKIRKSGDVDLQILGIGRNGHIGFNEPDVKFEALTHLVKLEKDTIDANSRFFNSISEVPTKAISMGIKTIMRAKKIVLIAEGQCKARVIERMVNGNIVTELPASILQLHTDTTIILDREAGKYVKN